MKRMGRRMTVAGVVDRGEAWNAIADLETRSVPRATEEVAALPPPAKRLLARAIPSGEVSVSALVLGMEGEIKLKGWLPFTGRQILHPTGGFVWNASVGRWWLRFRGGDTYCRGRGSLEFRLAGLVPVVRASGPDIDRSAAGRLAAETVAWAPQALFPSAGAVWQPIDHMRATVTRQLGGESIDVTVTVDDDGALQDLHTMRWGNPDGGQFGPHPFGGSVFETRRFDGVTIAAAGSVGWWWGTDRQAEGEFFRYRILDVHAATNARRQPAR